MKYGNWISCDYKLPQKHQHIVMHDAWNCCWLGYYEDNDTWIDYSGTSLIKITHWMPLDFKPQEAYFEF